MGELKTDQSKHNKNKIKMGLFDNLFKKKDIPEKMDFLGKDYEINPDSKDFSQQGLDKYQVKDYSGAVTAFTKAINAHPTNQNFFTMRGTAYEEMGKDSKAEKDFRKTLELLPNNFVAAYRLGMVYYRKKDFNNAIKWLKLSYENAPNGDHEHNELDKNNILFVEKKLIAGNLGNSLTQVKKYEESFKYLDEAIKLDPNYPNPYMTKGLVLAQTGEIKEAISYLEKAEKLGVVQAKTAIKMLKNM